MYGAARQRGMFMIQHSCGNVMEFLPDMIDAGLSCIQALEPASGINLAEVKQKYGDKLCLWGNIDVAETLVYGTKEDVFNEVKHCIKSAGQGGGLVISAANMHADVKVQNLRWMVEATREFGQYPLKI